MPLVLGGVRIDHPRGLAGHSDGDVLAHALTDARARRRRARGHRRALPVRRPGARRRRLARAARAGVGARARGAAGSSRTPTSCSSARSRGSRRTATRCARGSRTRSASSRSSSRCARRRRTASASPAAARVSPRRPSRFCGDEARASSRTPSSRSLRGTLPDLWPEFMAHDPVVQTFWPQLYDVYPDFQLWVVDREAGRARRVGYACSVPVGVGRRPPSPRGLDWALTRRGRGRRRRRCARSSRASSRSTAAAASPRRSCGGSRRVAAGARPRLRWSRRCGRRGRSAIRSSPIEQLRRVAARGRAPVRPVATHARAARRRARSRCAPRSMTITGTRAEWEEWTGMLFPEDGDYVVPGALVPGPLQERPRGRTSSPTSGSARRCFELQRSLAALVSARGAR